jgi:hypothetical protein
MRSLFTIAVLAALPALANITYACDPSFLSSAPAGTCANNLNGPQVQGVYGGIFSSSMSANIYITYGSTGVGQSSTRYTAISYQTYYNALVAHTDDPAALASLPLPSAGDPLNPLGSNGEIEITSALASALGITENGANTNGFEADGATSCTLGSPGCYNGVITVSDASNSFYYPNAPGDTPPTPPPYLIDFYYVVEHETDEVLGTVSCIGGDGIDGCTNGGATGASPADLFRYASAGTRTFLNASNGSSAYFSIDNGATDIADYNNSPIGGDYGDWLSGYPYMVQDALASPDVGLDISTDVGVNSNHYPRPEVAVLDAIGFDLKSQATPEPSTMALLGGGIAVLAVVRRRAGYRRQC